MDVIGQLIEMRDKKEALEKSCCELQASIGILQSTLDKNHVALEEKKKVSEVFDYD